MRKRVRTRNDRKGKKSRFRDFLKKILIDKYKKKETFWQLRGRKCKTCTTDARFCGKKFMNKCCENYKPKKKEGGYNGTN